MEYGLNTNRGKDPSTVFSCNDFAPLQWINFDLILSIREDLILLLLRLEVGVHPVFFKGGHVILTSSAREITKNRGGGSHHMRPLYRLLRLIDP